ncbi:MAG: hypothetical protein PUG70_06295 [Lachnospiraceae bacterium]|nr:hypothetical protein [Lachnospiraceae bacterium]MDY5520346.1 hypothetical protein [Agathobacter sp.]
MSKVGKIICGVFASMILSLCFDSATVKAEVSFTEMEDNNTIQKANEVTVSSEQTIVAGTMEDKEAECDWYKITFENHGKCNIDVVDVKDPTHNQDIMKRCVKVYHSDYTECKTYGYGIAHEEEDVFFIKIETTFIGLMPNHYTFDYQIVIDDDSSKEYVCERHTSTNSAYQLKEGVKVYALGGKPDQSKLFEIKVPKGLRAEITLEPAEDADLEVIAKTPFKYDIIQKSTGSELIRQAAVSSKTTVSSCIVSPMLSPKTVYFTGEDTYYVKVYGGSDLYPNYEWVSVKYKLVDKTKPTITGVKNGATYKKPVVIKFKDASGIKSAKINGKKLKSGTKISKKGSYTVTVVDKKGNSKTVKFKIK